MTNHMILIFSLFIFGVLSKEIQMYFQPKQCVETPWDAWYSNGGINFIVAPTDTQLLTAFLSSKGISIISSSKIETGNIVCSACECPTTYYYSVSVDNKYLKNMLKLGFQNKKNK